LGQPIFLEGIFGLTHIMLFDFDLLVYSFDVTEAQLNDVISLIVKTIYSTKNKSTCNLAVWCLSIQNINVEQMSRVETLETVIKAIDHALGDVGKESPSVRHEALDALGKLVVQCPIVVKMQSTANILVILLARCILDDVDKVREKANVIMALTLNHLQDSTTGFLRIPETLSEALANEITTNLLSQLSTKLIDGKENVVIRAWGYYVALLARSLIKRDLVNPLLKIPSTTFKSTNSDVRAETFQLWKKRRESTGGSV